jgi:hypothetical protein
MALDIRRRIAALESRYHVGKPKIAMWLSEGDGLVRGPEGEMMTREAFDAAFPNVKRITLDIFGERTMGVALSKRLRS